MRNFFLFLGFFALISCKKENLPTPISISRNQAEIINDYYKIDKALYTNTDTVPFLLEKMEKRAQNATNDYKAMASLRRGQYYLIRSSYELATKSLNESLKLLQNSNADSLKARNHVVLGNCYKEKGDHLKAIHHLQIASTLYEKLKNKPGIANAHATMGQVYFQNNDIESAKTNLKIAMNTLKQNKSKKGYLVASHTLANIYGMSGDYKSALKIDEEGLRIADSMNLPQSKATFLDNKGNCYMYSNQLDSAEYYFNACLKLDVLSDNQRQIADSYSNLGQLAIFKKNYKEAERQTLNSIEILKKIKQKPNLIKSYEILVDVYELQGKSEKALETQKIMFNEYKTMINEKKEASLAEYKIVYETQKKEKLLAENKVVLLQSQAESKQQKSTIAILSILAFFLAIVGYMIFRQQKLKSNQREQEFHLKTAISQIETQNKLQEQRLRISRDLHDNIGAQLTFIISSVDAVKFGFDLKSTKLDEKLNSISAFTKSTIVELRDTIWAMNNDEISFEDLRARIFNFIEKVKIAREDIYFKFNIDARLNDISVTSIQGINIYRSIQEALNNIIKYAEASEILISAELVENQICIQVKDNGKGFDINNIEKGNGMSNMEKRMEDIGGDFKVTSEIGSGTSIVFLLNMEQIVNDIV